MHGFSPEGEDLIRREALWNNKRIISGDSPLIRRGWEAKGICTIHDICHPSEARLLSHQELSAMYNVRCSFLDMLTLRLSIPLEWRRSISADWSPAPDPSERSGVHILLPGEQPMDILNASPKQLYRAFISTLGHVSTASERWHNHPDQSLKISNMDEWMDLSAASVSFQGCQLNHPLWDLPTADQRQPIRHLRALWTAGHFASLLLRMSSEQILLAVSLLVAGES